jgi:broad specificity phosphatase PhoE
MRTYVFIRHARKEYMNGKGPEGSFQHDPGILEDQENLVASRMSRLKRLYSSPQLLISSPYLRTRQTSALMGGDFPLLIDSRVSEYLGGRTPDETSLSEDTLSFSPPLVGEETITQLKERVKSFLDYLEGREETVIYICTHGVVIDMISPLILENETKDIPELGALILRINGEDKNIHLDLPRT